MVWKKLIKVNRYYPSSQLCNCCGYQNKELKDYSIRECLRNIMTFYIEDRNKDFYIRGMKEY